MKRCNLCANCMTLARWDVMYEDHLAKFPTKESKKSVKEMRAMDRKWLTCINAKKNISKTSAANLEIESEMMYDNHIGDSL